MVYPSKYCKNLLHVLRNDTYGRQWPLRSSLTITSLNWYILFVNLFYLGWNLGLMIYRYVNKVMRGNINRTRTFQEVLPWVWEQWSMGYGKTRNTWRAIAKTGGKTYHRIHQTTIRISKWRLLKFAKVNLRAQNCQNSEETAILPQGKKV